MQLNQFNPEAFLRKHWQKSPCLLSKAISNPTSFISADELAGLSLDEEVESRLIYLQQNQWHLEHGPFEESLFSRLPANNWTLLIQTADHWLTEVQPFLQGFNFIPRWRFDDLMISYATDGGGVGPHFDNYDVFIVQIEGTRRWQVGAKGDTDARSELINGLLHLESFTPIIDTLLEPGDILYIPPDTAHWGQSVGESISYSVGYRAPQTKDIMALLANHFDAGSQCPNTQNLFFSDPYRAHTNTAKIEPELIEWAQQELAKIANNKSLICQLLSQHLSQSKLDKFFDTTNYLATDIQKAHTIRLNPEVNYNWAELDDKIFISIEGEQFVFETTFRKPLTTLLSGKPVNIHELNSENIRFDFYQSLATILNKGYIEFDD
ncbi:cupin domain-containing protein [Aliikangiella maris]|uniref:Cupin domain-containing protein n=2 Tax=Aliikangiella maris TaxID=3162458 RepID=A0ABV2BP86_9GAMM